MDKIFCKRLLAQAGLPTPAWVELDRHVVDRGPGWHRRSSLALGLPLFVKPARLGRRSESARSRKRRDLVPAIELALNHGERVLVEKGLDAREIEVAVLGNRHPRAAVPGEVVPGHEFLRLRDKYVDSACELLAPAPLDEDTTAAAQDLGVKVFRLLGCSGMARVDLFLERDGNPAVGQRGQHDPRLHLDLDVPRLWGLSGLEYPALLDELIRLAVERRL